MRILAGAAALTGAAWAGAAAAQEFKGAELSAEILAFTEGDDLTANNYRGSVEFGALSAFGVAADLSFYDLEDGDTVRNVTLHVLYDAFQFATMGGFYARDSVDGEGASLLGLEAGRSFGPTGVEGYVALGDADGEGFVTFGFDGAFDITRTISLTASGAAIDIDGGGVSRLSVGGEYRFGETGPAVYAEIGRLGISDGTGFGDSTQFVGIGGRIAIGPNQGTTFESRGLYEVLGSF